MLRQILCWIFLWMGLINVYGQTPIWSLERFDNYASVVTGIGQLTQGGFNIEGNVFYKRLVVDYSHGMALQLPNSGLEDGADHSQGLSFKIPWTTGFGVGFRFTDWLNLRAEPKWHRFEVYQNATATPLLHWGWDFMPICVRSKK